MAGSSWRRRSKTRSRCTRTARGRQLKSDPSKTAANMFLNRLLGIRLAVQGQLFAFWQHIMHAKIREAKQKGEYQEGILDIPPPTTRAGKPAAPAPLRGPLLLIIVRVSEIRKALNATSSSHLCPCRPEEVLTAVAGAGGDDAEDAEDQAQVVRTSFPGTRPLLLPPPLVLSGHVSVPHPVLIGHVLSLRLNRLSPLSPSTHLPNRTNTPLDEAQGGTHPPPPRSERGERTPLSHQRALRRSPRGAWGHAACPPSTGGGTRLVRLVRGMGGGTPAGATRPAPVTPAHPPPALTRGSARDRAPPPPTTTLPYKVDTSRPSLRTNWTPLVPFPQGPRGGLGARDAAVRGVRGDARRPVRRAVSTSAGTPRPRPSATRLRRPPCTLGEVCALCCLLGQVRWLRILPLDATFFSPSTFPLLRSPPPPLNAPCAQGGACARQAPGAHGAQRARAAVQGLQPRGAIERVDKPPPLPPPASRPPPQPSAQTRTPPGAAQTERRPPSLSPHVPPALHPTVPIPTRTRSPRGSFRPKEKREARPPWVDAARAQRRCGRSGRRSMASTRTGAGAGRAGCPAARGRRARS